MNSIKRILYKKDGLLGGTKDFISRRRYPQFDDKKPRVIMYHSVEKFSGDWCPRSKYAVSPEKFEKQIKSFQRDGEIVDLKEIVSWLKGQGSLPDKAVAITFDDGYRNNIENALPVLEKFDASATIFVSTQTLKNGRPFEYCISELLKQKSHIDLISNGLNIRKNLENNKDRKNVYRKLKNWGKTRSQEERERLISMIGECSNKRRILMDEEEVRNISENPLINIGSHSHNHIMLNKIHRKKVRKNVRKSKQILEKITGEEVERFCYPYGASDKTVRNEVSKAGYKNALITSNRRIMPRDWGQEFRIPRLDGSDLKL